MNIFSSIREYCFRRQLLQQPKRDIAWPHWDRVHHILILYQSDLMERNPEIQSLVRELLQLDKDVTIWGWSDKSEVTSPILPQSRMLYSKNQTFWGCLREDVLRDLLRPSYDVVLDLTQDDILAMRYVVMLAHATWKAGRRKLPNNEKFYDFLLDMPISTATETYNEIIRFTQMIHSND